MHHSNKRLNISNKDKNDNEQHELKKRVANESKGGPRIRDVLELMIDL